MTMKAMLTFAGTTAFATLLFACPCHHLGKKRGLLAKGAMANVSPLHETTVTMRTLPGGAAGAAHHRLADTCQVCDFSSLPVGRFVSLVADCGLTVTGTDLPSQGMTRKPVNVFDTADPTEVRTHARKDVSPERLRRRRIVWFLPHFPFLFYLLALYSYDTTGRLGFGVPARLGTSRTIAKFR
jgi:hypothetical protein